ncbi:MAG: hypothetical protein Q8777_02450, partial [Candidatus Phytoplasma stylosanthis]|uniref:hypothetical protein n=1 Tax=Candidatus Phytoplasma stylosanthis TaxID=2798314 RepID=UPI002939A08B
MSNLMNNLLNQIQKKMKNYPETKDLVYGKDYREEDLIELDQYLTEKEHPHPKLLLQKVLVIQPHFQIRYRKTELALALDYQNKILDYHLLFKQ